MAKRKESGNLPTPFYKNGVYLTKRESGLPPAKERGGCGSSQSPDCPHFNADNGRRRGLPRQSGAARREHEQNRGSPPLTIVFMQRDWGT